MVVLISLVCREIVDSQYECASEYSDVLRLELDSFYQLAVVIHEHILICLTMPMNDCYESLVLGYACALEKLTEQLKQNSEVAQVLERFMNDLKPFKSSIEEREQKKVREAQEEERKRLEQVQEAERRKLEQERRQREHEELMQEDSSWSTDVPRTLKKAAAGNAAAMYEVALWTCNGTQPELVPRDVIKSIELMTKAIAASKTNKPNKWRAQAYEELANIHLRLQELQQALGALRLGEALYESRSLESDRIKQRIAELQQNIDRRDKSLQKVKKSGASKHPDLPYLKVHLSADTCSANLTTRKSGFLTKVDIRTLSFIDITTAR